MEITWKPSAQSMEVRRHVQDFVAAFMRGDYAQSRQAARQCGAQEDIREQHVAVDIDLARMQQMQHDPLESRFVQQEIDRVGEAQHGIENQGKVEQHHQFVVRLPQVRIDLGHGQKVDLTSGESTQPLDLTQQRAVHAVMQSDAGRRLQAEHALTLLEERLHVEQFREPGILSPTFARFATDVATPRRGSTLFEALLGLPKPRTLMEAEIPALLYDGGMPLDLIKHHFLSRHPQERERIVAYLYQRENRTPSAASH